MPTTNKALLEKILDEQKRLYKEITDVIKKIVQ